MKLNEIKRPYIKIKVIEIKCTCIKILESNKINCAYIKIRAP